MKYTKIETLPPIGKRKHYRAQNLTYIQALETDPPAGRPPIDWKLVTNLPVSDLAGAIEKLEWYALRWKIEVFHKVVKSGCRAEESRLQTAERLVKFLALITIVSWRVFFVTMSGPSQTRRTTWSRAHFERNQSTREYRCNAVKSEADTPDTGRVLAPDRYARRLSRPHT